VHSQDPAAIGALLHELRDPEQGGRGALLFIESWESVLSALRTSEHFGLEGGLLELIRDGGPSGLRILLGGNEGLSASRAASGASHTLHLPSARIEDDIRLAKAVAALGRGSSTVLLRSRRLRDGVHSALPASC